MSLLALLRLPKDEFKQKVEEILGKREWSDELDNQMFKVDPSKPWTNPWKVEDLVHEDITDERNAPESPMHKHQKFIVF